MTIGPFWKDIKNPPLLRIDQDALVFVGGSVAFEFVNGKSLLKLAERRIADGVQKTADYLDGNASKFCRMFRRKCLTKQ